MKCSKCGKKITRIQYLSEDKEPLCSNCAGKMTKCKCGLYTDKGCLCKNCAEKSFDNLINSYGTKVKHLFKNKEGTNECLNKRYYGFEIEYNYISPALLYYKNKDLYKNKLIYNKADSSIASGVEINIIPSDYSSIKKIIGMMDLLSLTKEQTIENLYKNAGVHIHVSSNSIPKEDIYKLNLLFNHTMNKKYSNYIYYLANRKKTQYNNYNDNYYEIGGIKYKKELGDSHNNAINFGNSNTVEFRLFGSTINKKRLLGYIEFVNLTLDFVNKNSIKKMSLKNLLIYIKEHAKSWSNKVGIRNIERSGFNLDTEEELNFSFRKLFELFNSLKQIDVEERIDILSEIPLENIDDNISVNNYKSYAMYSVDNNFGEILRKRIIEMIIRKEATTCV